MRKLTFNIFRLPLVHGFITVFQIIARSARRSHFSCLHEGGRKIKAGRGAKLLRILSTHREELVRKCSNTTEARYYTSKGQAHGHCPCQKCEDQAVYPMVAWRHMQKQAWYCDVNAESTELANSSIQPSINEAATSSPDTAICNDCFSVSHYYAEVNSSSSPLLLAAGARDVDETDESEVSDVDSFQSPDAVNESLSSEGSESDPGNISDGAEEQAGGMMDFVRDAVLRLVEIKGIVGFSISTFEDLLKWGLTCTVKTMKKLVVSGLRLGKMCKAC